MSLKQNRKNHPPLPGPRRAAEQQLDDPGRALKGSTGTSRLDDTLDIDAN